MKVIQENWLKLLISFLLVVTFPVIFMFSGHGMDDSDFIIVTSSTYYAGIVLLVLYLFDLPIASLEAKNPEDKPGRKFMLISGFILPAMSLYILFMK